MLPSPQRDQQHPGGCHPQARVQDQVGRPCVLEVELPSDVGGRPLRLLLLQLLQVHLGHRDLRNIADKDQDQDKKHLLHKNIYIWKATSGTSTCKILQYIKINNICSKGMFLLRNIFKRHEISLFQQGLFCGNLEGIFVRFPLSAHLTGHHSGHLALFIPSKHFPHFPPHTDRVICPTPKCHWQAWPSHRVCYRASDTNRLTCEPAGCTHNVR